MATDYPQHSEQLAKDPRSRSTDITTIQTSESPDQNLPPRNQLNHSKTQNIQHPQQPEQLPKPMFFIHIFLPSETFSYTQVPQLRSSSRWQVNPQTVPTYKFCLRTETQANS
ncbi:hypothetical protein V6Z11_D10G201700 [Gossypium hirsutum]